MTRFVFFNDHNNHLLEFDILNKPDSFHDISIS